MHVIRTGYALSLQADFVAIIQEVIDAHPGEGALCLNFRDPDYGAEHGGFHPVEVAIGADGALLYVTGFAYVGQAPFAELAKELDWDFSQEVFESMGRVFSLAEGDQLFQLWQRNFCAYYRSEVYLVEVTRL